jgi:oligopeptide/dipeptide ABC transporter ATP-binding protein
MITKQNEPILQMKNLSVNFRTYRGEVRALQNVDLEIFRHEVLALVGESGCGKSVTALTILSLLPPNGHVTEGEILLNDMDLLKKTHDEMRYVRSNEIAAVFQDPMTYLNPVLTIAAQLKESFLVRNDFPLSLNQTIEEFLATKRSAEMAKVHGRQREAIAEQLSVDLLKLVRLSDPERVMKQYPFELSGGMRQRCMIAMALARRPHLLIADEITTALDVTIQAQVLSLLMSLRDSIDASTLLITHDLSIAAETADRIAVMYAGNIVEVASAKELFRNPLHPYTRLLMRCIPDVRKPKTRLESIKGNVPDLIDPPSGCRFNPRCPKIMDECRTMKPTLKNYRGDHLVHCFLYQH